MTGRVVAEIHIETDDNHKEATFFFAEGVVAEMSKPLFVVFFHREDDHGHWIRAEKALFPASPKWRHCRWTKKASAIGAEVYDRVFKSKIIDNIHVL